MNDGDSGSDAQVETPPVAAPTPVDPNPSLSEFLRMFVRFLKFIRPYWKHVALVSILMLVQVPVAQTGIFMVKDIVDLAITAVKKPQAERLHLLFAITALSASFWLLDNLIWKVREIMNYYACMRGVLDLRLAFYKHLHKLPMAFLQKRSPGEHLYRSTSDILNPNNDPGDLGVMTMVAWSILPVAEALYTLAWTGAFLALIDPHLLIGLAIYIPLYFTAIYSMVGWGRKFFVVSAFAGSDETGVLSDSIAGLRAVKSTGRAAWQRKLYAKANRRARAATMRQNWAFDLLNTNGVDWGSRWVFGSLLYLYLTMRVVHGDASIGQWTVAMALIDRIRTPIANMISALQLIRVMTVNCQRIVQTLDVPPTLLDPPGAPKVSQVRGEIAFEHVSLTYTDHLALSDVSFTIRAGEAVGLVGPSGAGKSSAISALLRLFPLCEGRVTVDGYDVTQIRLQSLLDQMAVVPQSTFLYEGTIRDNILFSQPKATDEEVVASLTAAGLGPLLELTPEGLDYRLGMASTLSGGERQRIGLARALVRDPRILIFDEATANLDAATEDLLLRHLTRHFAGRTVLVVAHRLKAVANCDRILVMEAGRIVDEGSHGELLERNAWYRGVWQEQQSGRKPEETARG